MMIIEAIPSILGAAAIVPPLIYLFSVTFFDNRPEPAVAIVGSFLLAMVSTYLLQLIPPAALTLGTNFLLTVTALFRDPSERAILEILATFIQALADIAAPEETVKLLILIAFSRRFIAFDHPMEGIVYGAAVGLGFAAYENMLLVVHLPDAWREHTIIRSVLTVPTHGALGIIAGIYVARARFGGALGAAHGRPYRWKSYAAAWLVPMILHALYNFPLLLVRNVVGFQSPHAHLLQTTGFVVGTAVILVAARLVYRISVAQVAAAGHYHSGSILGQRAWRLDLLGGFASLLGALMVLAEVHGLLRGHALTLDRHIFILLGSGFVALAAHLHHRATPERRQLLAAREGTPV
jgi:RsiW-degrading membrane proteinase PrsW (M82 family)